MNGILNTIIPNLGIIYNEFFLKMHAAAYAT